MEKFKVTIPCKPYVRRFIELNFGDPAEISKDRSLYELFRGKLQKKCSRRDSAYPAFGKYAAEMDFIISRDDFYRHGWELSKTDIVALNRILEGRVKILMYTAVGSRIAFGFSLVDSIEYFQNEYSFTEDIWPKESIVKDCRRNLPVLKNQINIDFSEIIKKNVWPSCRKKGQLG